MTDAARLVALLEGFHIADRALARSRERAQKQGDEASAAALRREMQRYFSGVEREASSQLRSLDARLDDLYQRQYNLHAERGVAQRRLENARAVLAALEKGDGS